MPTDTMPSVVAILRGIEPARILNIGSILFDAGIRIIEVPLNSPRPFDSIERLAREFGDRALCGAGTVLDPKDVVSVKDAGGKLIVSPNTDTAVITSALAQNLKVMPGFATPTEALTAVGTGARLLKLFPASTYGATHVKALKAVLPADVAIYAVGGVGADDMQEWAKSGVAGFGFGSELFKPAYSDDEIRARARRVMEAVSKFGKS